MANTINCTIDKDTHRLWKIVAKKDGLSMIDEFRTLVVKEAKYQGLRIPRSLKDFGDYF